MLKIKCPSCNSISEYEYLKLGEEFRCKVCKKVGLITENVIVGGEPNYESATPRSLALDKFQNIEGEGNKDNESAKVFTETFNETPKKKPLFSSNSNSNIETHVSYKYKCVPAPMEIVIDNKTDMKKAVESFANIINDNSTDGWEFFSLENISVTQNPGCLSGLFGAKPYTKQYNMLIFVKK
jgi:hypothetical protein